MHGHETVPQWASEVAGIGSIGMVAILAVLAAFMAGVLPIPVGIERGKVKWLMWCGTGMHAHIVYYTDSHGFQTLHPSDKSSGGGA